MNKNHPCYLPENANALQSLRDLERRHKYGLLTRGGYFEMLKLKEKLGIG